MSKGVSYEVFNNSDDDILKMSNLELSDIDKSEVLTIIQVIRDDVGMNTYEKGKILEDLIEKIMSATKVFKCLKNKHTTSNEFDILVKLNTNGKILRDKKIIPQWIPDHFLIECKNHKCAVEVGLVGKFYSLMDVSKVSLGLFISKIGITGAGELSWQDATAFVKKINLKYSERTIPMILLDLDLNDIERVTDDDMDIIEIIETRKIDINMDINSSIGQWIKPHENEHKF
ncbi:hypothetical protein [Clostridium estertheticum]|uniref:hypothetical protein n=1 Tax=Clostridium estertheticum TaxID=238834 RepID=UPI001CF1D05F|nr:hypothetical protein [Clostridium estertheticum]MCB2361976.1 hypothetical protein [Clostridium estertheticum]